MDIKKLSEKNPWWKDKSKIEEDEHITKLNQTKYKRDYVLIKEFDEGIYSIRGPRQVGKTTWIKKKIKELLKIVNPKNIFYYSLDLVSSNKELHEIITTYLSYVDGKKYIFLDEIPNVKDWQYALKDLYDSGKLKDCCVIVTGSHSLDIAKNIEKLPGRTGIGKRDYIFFPMNFHDYYSMLIGSEISLNRNIKENLFTLELNSKKIQNIFDDYLITGGFPYIINYYEENKEINQYNYEIYIKWIIGDLAKWKINENLAKQILWKILDSYSSELSWTTIKSGTDADSHNTISRYIYALEEMFLLEYIYLFDPTKLNPSFRKNKKIYFSDPFLFRTIINWLRHDNSVKEMPLIIEGIVLNNIISWIQNKAETNLFDYKDHIFYYRNKTRTKEVDFVLKNKFWLEVKWSSNTSNCHKKTIVLSKNTLDIKNKIIPVSYFLILYPIYEDKLIKFFKSSF